MGSKLRAGALLLVAVGAALAGCEEQAPTQQTERIRAIKPYYVSEPAAGDVRRYSGTIAATNTSALGFALSGTVATVAVKKGDRVKKGDIVATLDAKPFELDVRAAKAELAARRAERNQVIKELDRQQQLYRKGWVSKAGYEKAVAQAGTSEEALNLARARVGIAERDLEKTRLQAPFDGVIATRAVEPFTEVSRGQTIVQIDSEGGFEVEVSVSDAVIDRLALGAPVTIEASTVNNCGCAGRVTEIGTQASAANTVPVTAVVTQAAQGLIPGMGVEVGILLSNEARTGGYLVPVVAIAPGDASGSGYVFKFDPEAGVVRKVAVKGGAGLDGNLVGISEGVAPGDILAAAGVSFLRDGQRVKLLER